MVDAKLRFQRRVFLFKSLRDHEDSAEDRAENCKFWRGTFVFAPIGKLLSFANTFVFCQYPQLVITAVLLCHDLRLTSATTCAAVRAAVTAVMAAAMPPTLLPPPSPPQPPFPPLLLPLFG